MACSKLFSGDLPHELLNEVIQNFHYDYKTLHSCILVNRLWCRLAIPLLWEDPFSKDYPKNYQFIEIYFSKLNEDDKTKFNEYGIKFDLLHSNTLFNYPSFIKYLDTNKIRHSIENWAVGATTTSRLQVSDFTKLIFRLLFVKFIENEVNLHSFKVRPCACFNEILGLIQQNPKFICNITNFKLDWSNSFDDIREILRILCSNCYSISSLYFFPFLEYAKNEKSLSQLIKSQKNLQKILFSYNHEYTLYHPLLSLQNSNCSNTLNTIIFYLVDFKNIVVLSEVFNQLNVLESIHIVYCYSMYSNFIHQINNITKPFKLKTLFLNEIIYESLELLLQKSGNYLENLNFRYTKPRQFQKLLRLFIKYCSNISNIKYIDSICVYSQNNCYLLLLNLIKNITQKLNYLTITVSNSILLKNLGQILPFKLEYLDLSLLSDLVNASDLEIFLKKSQNTFIKKLLISTDLGRKDDDILPYIEEHIMKTKRVKYLALEVCREDLFFQTDKVKEFALHNICVFKYNDLKFDIINFLEEIH
ncbi:hypothetical protein RhiirA1_470979 [Rhizophagus irregularis]|uniref:F-box domain-containing protein n=1 Tax=Rhizophagus irregularis TaxID=588596 RepID=A0A2N0R561_9GLOM|nr:hypothetical protein RhiirA1_470979 [Rhizophagus irregularis]